MTKVKSSLSFAMSVTFLAGAALLAGCAQPASRTTTSEVTAPPPAMASTTTDTMYRRQ